MERAFLRLAFEIKHMFSSSGDAQWCFPTSNKCCLLLMANISSPFLETVSVVFILDVQAASDFLPLKWHSVLEW